MLNWRATVGREHTKGHFQRFDTADRECRISCPGYVDPQHPFPEAGATVSTTA